MVEEAITPYTSISRMLPMFTLAAVAVALAASLASSVLPATIMGIMMAKPAIKAITLAGLITSLVPLPPGRKELLNSMGMLPRITPMKNMADCAG